MTKTYLLAAAAVTAMVAAGGAQAASISARAGAVAVTASSPYALASQLNLANGVASTAGQFDTVIAFNAPLAAGTYTVTLSYSGATVNAAVPAAAVVSAAGNTGANACSGTAEAGFESATAGGATLTLTGGGQAGSNGVTYTLQVNNGATVGGVCFAPALRVTGPVSATASVTNQVTGQPVDPSVIQPLITTSTSGFTTTVNGVIGAGALADDRIIEGTAAPFFSSLAAAADGQLGTVAVGVSGTTTYKDLNGTAVSATDITGGTLTVAGSLTGLVLTGASTAGGNTIAIPASGGTTAIIVDEAGTPAQLTPSTYAVSGTVTLGSVFSGPLAIASANLETIETSGAAYVVPWVASATQAGASGSNTVIRVSNIGGGSTFGGRVYGQIYNPTTGVATTGFALLGTLAGSGTNGGGEIIINSGTLEGFFGNFGRADFRLVVTSSAGTSGTNTAPSNTAPVDSNIVVTRFVQSANGGLSEVNVLSGAVGSAVPHNSSVPY